MRESLDAVGGTRHFVYRAGEPILNRGYTWQRERKTTLPVSLIMFVCVLFFLLAKQYKSRKRKHTFRKNKQKNHKYTTKFNQLTEIYRLLPLGVKHILRSLPNCFSLIRPLLPQPNGISVDQTFKKHEEWLGVGKRILHLIMH